MIGWKRKKRVRLHFIAHTLPSVEGLLVSRRRREYIIGLPELINDPDMNPVVLQSRLVAIPRENVAFYEVVE